MTDFPYTTSNVVSIAAEREVRSAAMLSAQDTAFTEYVRLSRRAQQTLTFEDGIAAGRAWGNFIGLFVRRA